MVLAWRATHPLFRDITTGNALFIKIFKEVVNAKLAQKLPNDNMLLENYCQAIQWLFQEAQASPNLARLINPVLRIKAKHLWDLRYCRGMPPRATIAPILEGLDIPVNRSLLNTLQAMRLGYYTLPGKTHFVIEGLKIGASLGSSIFLLVLTNSIPYPIDESCKTIYYFPQNIFWWPNHLIDRNLSNVINPFICVAIPSAMNIICHFLPNWDSKQFSCDAGMKETYHLIVKILSKKNKQWQKRIRSPSHIAYAVTTGVIALAVPLTIRFLYARTYAVPIEELTLHDYYETVTLTNKYLDPMCCIIKMNTLETLRCAALTFSRDNDPIQLATSQYMVLYERIILMCIPLLVMLFNFILYIL